MKNAIESAVLLFAKLQSLQPARFSDATATLAARLLYWVANRNHRAILGDYLQSHPALPPGTSKWRPVRKMYRAYLRNGLDGLFVLGASTKQLQRRLGNMDVRPLQELLTSHNPNTRITRTTSVAGKGALVAFPHMASFAVLGPTLAVNGIPVTVVGNKQRWPIGWLIQRAMDKCGIEFIPVDRTGKRNTMTAVTQKGIREARPIELMEDAVQRGQVVLVAGDYLSPHKRQKGRGVHVELAGRTREVGVGCALIALRTNVPVIAAAVLQQRSQRTLAWTEGHSATERL